MKRSENIQNCRLLLYSKSKFDLKIMWTNVVDHNKGFAAANEYYGATRPWRKLQAESNFDYWRILN